MDTLEVIKAARELISDPARWTQGHDAVDAVGRRVDPRGDDACRFCTAGALWKVSPIWPNVASDELDKTALGFGKAGLVDLNDTLNHAKVMRMFDDTIQRLEIAAETAMQK